MFSYLIQGLMLGLAYVAPIGMQNIYVINTAISRDKLRAYQVALITVFFDITLALVCFFGVGSIIEKTRLIKGIILLIGCIIVIYIGIGLIYNVGGAKKEVDVNKSLPQVILNCFMVTFANPQAIIDGSLLLGGFKASLADGSNFFIIGMMLASFGWFIGLTTAVSLFRKNFNEKVIKLINKVCGIVIIYYGLKLGYHFIGLLIDFQL